ncbi:hypothetical protein ER45_028300 (plasmid) [Bacillus mycoides]|nr:hypothetical protein ER45_028300 [Bacillus mycoides]
MRCVRFVYNKVLADRFIKYPTSIQYKPELGLIISSDGITYKNPNLFGK